MRTSAEGGALRLDAPWGSVAIGSLPEVGGGRDRGHVPLDRPGSRPDGTGGEEECLSGVRVFTPWDTDEASLHGAAAARALGFGSSVADAVGKRIQLTGDLGASIQIISELPPPPKKTPLPLTHEVGFKPRNPNTERVSLSASPDKLLPLRSFPSWPLRTF